MYRILLVGHIVLLSFVHFCQVGQAYSIWEDADVHTVSLLLGKQAAEVPVDFLRQEEGYQWLRRTIDHNIKTYKRVGDIVQEFRVRGARYITKHYALLEKHSWVRRIEDIDLWCAELLPYASGDEKDFAVLACCLELFDSHWKKERSFFWGKTKPHDLEQVPRLRSVIDRYVKDGKYYYFSISNNLSLVFLETVIAIIKKKYLFLLPNESVSSQELSFHDGHYRGFFDILCHDGRHYERIEYSRAFMGDYAYVALAERMLSVIQGCWQKIGLECVMLSYQILHEKRLYKAFLGRESGDFSSVLDTFLYNANIWYRMTRLLGDKDPRTYEEKMSVYRHFIESIRIQRSAKDMTLQQQEDFHDIKKSWLDGEEVTYDFHGCTKIVRAVVMYICQQEGLRDHGLWIQNFLQFYQANGRDMVFVKARVPFSELLVGSCKYGFFLPEKSTVMAASQRKRLLLLRMVISEMGEYLWYKGLMHEGCRLDMRYSSGFKPALYTGSQSLAYRLPAPIRSHMMWKELPLCAPVWNFPICGRPFRRARRLLIFQLPMRILPFSRMFLSKMQRYCQRSVPQARDHPLNIK